jgi:hypothetical protein
MIMKKPPPITAAIENPRSAISLNASITTPIY